MTPVRRLVNGPSVRQSVILTHLLSLRVYLTKTNKFLPKCRILAFNLKFHMKEFFPTDAVRDVRNKYEVRIRLS